MTVPVEVVSNNDLFETASLEIEQLARSDVAESDFFPQLVAKLRLAVQAEAGAVWLLDPNGMDNRVCEYGFDALGLDQNRQASRLNIQYMLDAIQNGEPKIHSFRDNGESENPVDRPLLAVPIRRGEDNIGVVELFLPLDSRPEERLEKLQFVEEMCHYAGRYLAWRQQLTSPKDQLDFWDRFEQFQSALHQSLDSDRITSAAVNDSRHLLGCDRVSIAVRRGPKTILTAVSGQECVSQRSNAVSGLTALASEVIADAQTVSFSGSLIAAPPHLERQLQDYSEISKSRTIVMIPLLESKLDQPDDPADELPRAFGALIVEHFSAEWLTPLTASRADLVAGHVSTALENARRYEGVFLLPLRRKLGRCFGLLTGRRLAVAGIVAALLACAILTLCIVPATYRVTGEGKLMPVIQRRVFAPWDGEVVAIHVIGGQHVEQDQVLIELRNDDITAQHVAVRNQLEAATQKLTALEAALDSVLRSSARKELIELQGRIAQTRIEIEGLQQRDKLLRRQFEQKIIRAPIAGTVATFQIDQLLKNRPVRRGDVLLEVMDKTGPWQLELEVPEQRVGHLTNGRPPETVHGLSVEFALATKPEARYSGKVGKLAGRTSLSNTYGTVTNVLVEIERDDIPDCRIGADVQAKIDCGKKSLAYVLFGDVVEFVQKRLW